MKMVVGSSADKIRTGNESLYFIWKPQFTAGRRCQFQNTETLSDETRSSSLHNTSPKPDESLTMTKEIVGWRSCRHHEEPLASQQQKPTPKFLMIVGLNQHTLFEFVCFKSGWWLTFVWFGKYELSLAQFGSVLKFRCFPIAQCPVQNIQQLAFKKHLSHVQGYRKIAHAKNHKSNLMWTLRETFKISMLWWVWFSSFAREQTLWNLSGQVNQEQTACKSCSTQTNSIAELQCWNKLCSTHDLSATVSQLSPKKWTEGITCHCKTLSCQNACTTSI